MKEHIKEHQSDEECWKNIQQKLHTAQEELDGYSSYIKTIPLIHNHLGNHICMIQS